jgi:hypothetical protein
MSEDIYYLINNTYVTLSLFQAFMGSIPLCSIILHSLPTRVKAFKVINTQFVIPINLIEAKLKNKLGNFDPYAFYTDHAPLD